MTKAHYNNYEPPKHTIKIKEAADRSRRLIDNDDDFEEEEIEL
jgi:hypothetical protein